MSRTEMIERIVTMFAEFPTEIQEAIATGMEIEKLRASRQQPEPKPAEQ